MKTEKAKMVFAGVKQVRRCDDTDAIKAEYATIQISVTVFHPVTHQLAPDDSTKFLGSVEPRDFTIPHPVWC